MVRARALNVVGRWLFCGCFGLFPTQKERTCTKTIFHHQTPKDIRITHPLNGSENEQSEVSMENGAFLYVGVRAGKCLNIYKKRRAMRNDPSSF